MVQEVDKGGKWGAEEAGKVVQEVDKGEKWGVEEVVQEVVVDKAQVAEEEEVAKAGTR